MVEVEPPSAAAMGDRVKSAVSFTTMDTTAVGTTDYCMGDGGGGGGGGSDNGDDDDEMLLVDPSHRTRLFSVSQDRPITRIPTRVEMKTLTHKAKRPAVDIEFHDLAYVVNTTAGM